MMFNYLLVAIAQLATLGTTFAGDDFFVMGQCASLTVSRIDPIVNAGAVAKHVHNVCGGSGFGPNLLGPSDQVGSSCSSAVIGDDKSNYWAPQLYWQYPNGTYQPMIGGGRIYYFMKGDNVKPFPPGLHMISGDSMIRDTSSKKSFGVRLSCNHGPQSWDLPQKKCDAISLGIFFPSCGLADGSISSEDNFSHMAWPIKQLGGGSAPFDDENGDECPASHPIKYPTIFYESNYYPIGGQNWEEGTKLVLSNGDEWGASYHADFHAGWVPSTLEQTIKQCGGYGKGPGENLQACAPLAPTVSQENSWDCRYEGKIPNEDVGFSRPIASLPGCNPPWPKDMVTKPGCANPPADPEMVYPNVKFRNLKYRSNIPTIFTEMNVTTDAAILKSSFAPSLGETAQSFYVPWGSDGSNKAKLRVSTVENLLQSGGSTSGDQNSGPVNDAPEAVPSASSSAASSSASAASSADASKSAQASSSSSVIEAASSQAQTSASASTSHSISMPGAVTSAASSAASSALAAPSVTGTSHSSSPSADSAGAVASHGIGAGSGSSHSAAEAGAPTSSSASIPKSMPTAGHAASPGGKTCRRKGHRVHHKRSMSGLIGRRSRRKGCSH